MKKYLMLLFTMVFILGLRAQTMVLKTNLLYAGVSQTPNLGMEVGLGKRISLNLEAGYNFWNLSGSEEDNKKRVHWLIQPEFRYWLCQNFNGHFFGIHGLYSQYNIGGYNYPLLFGDKSDSYRFEGNAYGGGLAYGYNWVLGKRWNLEFEIGGGIAVMKYDKYDCAKCGDKIGTYRRTYLGPTKAAITLVFLIK